MKILVTNDDGYKAKGLHELVTILRSYGDVTVVAPKQPQSGMSMAVSMGLKPIAVRRLAEMDANPTPNMGSTRWWYLDGTPASCVKFGIDNIFLPSVPDIVVSGINHGSNAATAALYSGTLGAALEGAVNGVPAIGVSLNTFDHDADFSQIRRLFPGIFERLMFSIRPGSGLYYNINFPDLPASEIKGMRVCRMGMGHWEKEYRPYREFLAQIGRESTPEAEAYIAAKLPDEEIYVMAGDFISDEPGSPAYKGALSQAGSASSEKASSLSDLAKAASASGSAGTAVHGGVRSTSDVPADHLLLEEGYVTLTPLALDNTCYDSVERLAYKENRNL